MNNYVFSETELKSLTLLLRKHEETLDPELDGFLQFLERYVYSTMTIEEAEHFFR